MARFENGYIKWHRSAFFGDIGTNIHCLGLWVALLSMATWKDSEIIWKGERRALPAGSVVLGLRELAQKLDCSKDTISRWLDYLRKSDRIALEHSTRGSLVTVLNWSTYQAAGGDAETPERHGPDTGETLAGHDTPPTVGRQPTLIEEEKKVRREEGEGGNKTSTLTPESLRECTETWKRTLKHFGGERDLLEVEERHIAQAIQRYRDAKSVALALVGPREQPKDDRFDPGKYLNLERILSKDKFNLYLNLGAQWLKRREGRAS